MHYFCGDNHWSTSNSAPVGCAAAAVMDDTAVLKVAGWSHKGCGTTAWKQNNSCKAGALQVTSPLLHLPAAVASPRARHAM
eukprot:6151292-Amphidinium_carterae.1